MLVYFINHSTAPINLGGAERSMIKLVEDWYGSDPEFEAFFITKAPRGRFIDAIEQRGWAYKAFRYRGWTIPKHDAPVSEITYFARDDYAATLDIIRLMEDRRPDLVVTNTVVAPWGAFAAAVLGIPHAWFVREYGDLDHGLAFQTSRREVFEDIGALSQAVFTNSLALKAHVGQYLDEDTVSVVYPSVDADAILTRAQETPASQPFPASDHGMRVTVVGRLSDTKGQWRVIDAIGELARRGVTASLCLVGSQEIPDYDVGLRARAERLGIGDRVTVVGEQENPYAFIRSADVCVTPSGLEAFGRSTLEYMIVGRAAIASSGGGSAELVVPGETGYLFDPDDPARLADLLAEYAAQPDRVADHGAAGARRARELLSGQYSNQAAIQRLKGMLSATPASLPNIARYWFALPGHYFSAAGRAPRITAAFVLTRLGGRTRNLVRRAIAPARRRIRDSRAR